MTYLNKNTELRRGYNTYIDTAEDDYGTMMDVGLLLMEEGDSFTIWEEEKECAVLLFQGAAEIAFASAAAAVVRNEALTDESVVYYLYIFEKGTPILVSFGYHGASGSFVFLPKEQCGTLADLQGTLPELEITPVEN